MVAIEIGNSYSQVKNLDVSKFKLLRTALSYVSNQSAYYIGGFVRTKYLIDKKGFFPTGLLQIVEDTLKTGYIVKDNRVVPDSLPKQPKINLNGITPYPDQIKAIGMAITNHRGGIVLPTGTGKSLVIALIASRLNVKTLVVVPSLEIKKQLKRTINDVLGHNNNVTVENIGSSKLKDLKGFDCLILDECHHAASKTYQVLNKTAWNGIYYRFFLTATFFRNQTNENLLFEGIVGQVFYSLSIKEAISKKYIVPVEVYYYDLPKVNTDAYTWAQVYSELVVNNDFRNDLIAKLLISINNNAPVLCLVKEIAHGEILSRLTGIPFANGQDEDTRSYIENFNKGKIKSLIGTTGIIGEGIDTKPAEYIIIAGLGKAKSAFLQQIGRGVRNYKGKESCKVILFRDRSHKFTVRHYNAQSKIVKEELGILPLKLDN